jgi:hypothetical protein
MWNWAIAVSALVVVCLVLNAMRYVTDGVHGTTAHINLNLWNHLLYNVNSEDVRAAGLMGYPLPLRMSAEQLRELVSSCQRRSGSDNSLPDLQDPWGHPVLVELLAQAPELRWRVTTRVGRSFFGAWIDKTIILP